MPANPPASLTKLNPLDSLKDWDRYVSITFTIDPKMNDIDYKRQLENTQGCVVDVLDHISTNWAYSIELTKQANIHYHAYGCIRPEFLGKTKLFKGLELKITNYKKKHNGLLGFMRIKRCHDLLGWTEYMKKDISVTKDLLRQPCFIVKKDLTPVNTLLERIKQMDPESWEN